MSASGRRSCTSAAARLTRRGEQPAGPRSRQVVYVRDRARGPGRVHLGDPAAVLVFVLALFIKEVPLRGRRAGRGEPAAEPELVG